MAQQPRQHKELKVAEPLPADPNLVSPTISDATALTPVETSSPTTAPAANSLPVAKLLPASQAGAAKPVTPVVAGVVATTAAQSTSAAAAPVATPGKQAAANSQASVAAAHATGATEAAIQPTAWQLLLSEGLHNAPAWLASMLVHLILLLSLGLIFVPEVREEIQSLVSSSAEIAPPGEISELPIENALDDVEMEQQPDALTEPLGTETGQAGIQGLGGGMEVGPVSEAPAATAMDIQIADIGAAMVPQSDLTKEVGGVVGRGLEGRGEANRKALVAQGGGNAYSEAAVDRALEWLARHQSPDGSWSFDHTRHQCQGRCDNPGNIVRGDLGATALGLLPFLGAGHTHKVGKYQRTVQMGLYYLVNSMKIDANGGSLVDEGAMYSHGIGAICLCEAYAMSEDSELMEPAQQALNFIVYAQDKIGGGWRYVPGQPGDTSVVGWQLMALKSGHMAYLAVPPQTIIGIDNFLNTTQAESGSTYGYTGPGNGAGTSAVGLLCRMYLGWKKHNPSLERGVERLGKLGPSEGNVYFNYYATQVLHHFGGDVWEKWNKVMRDYLINTQNKTGHEDGSWYFRGDHGADRGGRLYITALCCMTLEVYYRHLPLYGESSIENEFDEAEPAAKKEPAKKKKK